MGSERKGDMTGVETRLDMYKRGRIALRTGNDEARRQAILDLRADGADERGIQMLLRPEEVGL